MKNVFLALLTGLVVLQGCDSAVPSGVNFVSVTDNKLVLNQQGETWRLFVGGADKTLETGLRSTPSLAGGNLQTYFEFAGGPSYGLPQKFSIQQTTAPTFRCVECDESLRHWTKQ
jgi:hypothetical protein